MENSIAETFKNGTVLITGSTGFLGKLLLEKLLRSCFVKNIAVLVRSKKGFNANQRVADIYKQTLFDRLRKEKPDFMNCIKIIDGNIEEQSMGLSPNDRKWIAENVNFVFHCAATIKFNEPLELATKINVHGTENVLELAKEMKNLKGFVHVSTAYSHCNRNEIREQYYPVPITNKELTNMLGINKLSSKTLESWPNSYTFTKAITENLISINEYKLPISVFRPSIILCSQSEPIPGWLENLNGPSGIITGVMTGFLRAVPIAKNKITDIIPVDYTVNALIGVMWDTVNRHHDPAQFNKEPKIYNYVSSAESPLTWSRYIKELCVHYYVAPPLQSMWYICYTFYTNLWIGKMLMFFLHRIPAAVVDSFLILSGKTPKMLKMYSKSESVMELLHVFTTREWKFENSNTKELWLSLSEEDCNTFWFSLERFDWNPYIKNYYFGIRKHLLHEDLSNAAKAKVNNRKLFWLHHLLIVLIIYLILQVWWIIV